MGIQEASNFQEVVPHNVQIPSHGACAQPDTLQSTCAMKHTRRLCCRQSGRPDRHHSLWKCSQCCLCRRRWRA